jgi:deferrochelatase/peroxidase EfeB
MTSDDLPPPTEGRPRAFGRRQLLTAAVATGTAALVPASITSADSNAAAAPPDNAVIAFHGLHQNGAVRTPTSASAFLSCDVTVGTKDELIALMKRITHEARLLMHGGERFDTALGQPPVDNLMLGVHPPADGLSITVGVGASLFDDRFGLASRQPAALKLMQPFPNDDLDPAICHGDLSIYIQAHHLDAVLRAVRLLASATQGSMQIRWRYDGFRSVPRPSGASRNPLGFKDGIANPQTGNADQMHRLVWVTGGVRGEPAWVTGGTYQVMRVIRCLVEFWDRVSLKEQEEMFGRRKDNGAPLTGNHEDDVPDYAADPNGYVIPLTSHIRLSNPRTPETADSRILRRGVSYDRGMDSNGNLDTGLLFICYQQDIVRQFEANQARLVDEPLVDYILPIGGGYFFVLPGVKTARDWFGRGLLS